MIGLLGPAASALSWTMLLRSAPRSVLAPLLEPWAGHLYGHADCTLASVAPDFAFGARTLGVLALVLARRAAQRSPSWGAAPAWSLASSGGATLSLANTLS